MDGISIKYPVYRRKGTTCSGCGKYLTSDEPLVSINLKYQRFTAICESCQKKLIDLLSHKDDATNPNIIRPLNVESPVYYQRKKKSFYTGICPRCGAQIGSVSSKKRCYFCLAEITWPDTKKRGGELNGSINNRS